MDELNLDTFPLEHNAWDDALFEQAQKHIRQCPCNQSGDTESRCAHCSLIQSLFPRRHFNIDPPKERKPALEIVSSRTNPGSPQASEHTPPRQAVGGQESKGLPVEWEEEWEEEWDGEWDEECDEEWEDGRLEFGDSRPKDVDGILGMERYITLEELEIACDETLGMTDTSQTEPEPNSCLIFSSPALRLVWGESLVSNHQQDLQGRNTCLQSASRIIFKQARRRGTAHAVGVWAARDNPSI